MGVVRWAREQAVGPATPGVLDELDGAAALVVEGLTGADDCRWWRWAPCVVIAVGDGPASVDVVVGDDEVDELLAGVRARPQASRVLVDVLRATERLDVADALVLESLAYSLLLTGGEFAAWLASAPGRPPGPSGSEPVRAVRQGDELRITLARPARRNAFSAGMRDRLWEALALVEADETIGQVVIDGEGPSFCSGGDLAEFGTTRDAVRAHEIRTLRSVGAAIARVAPRVTARVHGPCVGAGVELSAFAGTVVAAPGTTFRLPEVGMGLIPGAGGTVSITRRIGRQRTAWLALSGHELDTDRARRWGLVDAIA